MANRKKGGEDIFKPFAKRRHRPGSNAGQHRVGYSEVSFAMTRARSLIEAACIAINRFGVPRRTVRLVLGDNKRNNVKLMRLVELSKRYIARKRGQSKTAVARAPGAAREKKAWIRYLTRGADGRPAVPRRPTRGSSEDEAEAV